MSGFFEDGRPLNLQNIFYRCKIFKTLFFKCPSKKNRLVLSKYTVEVPWIGLFRHHLRAFLACRWESLHSDQYHRNQGRHRLSGYSFLSSLAILNSTEQVHLEAISTYHSQEGMFVHESAMNDFRISSQQDIYS